MATLASHRAAAAREWWTRENALDLPVDSQQGSSAQHEAKLRSPRNSPIPLLGMPAPFFVSALPFQLVNSYTRVDSQLTWKFAEQAERSLVGQNLLQIRHLESTIFLPWSIQH